MYNTELSLNLKEKFINLIAENAGLHIRKIEQQSLGEKIISRMKELKLPSPESYYNFLETLSFESQKEWQLLLVLLTNTESYFFRDKGQLKLLNNHILPEIIKRKQSSKTLSICSAGCSTGDEPYSLAIQLKQLIPDIEQWNILILGVDINQEALAKAKKGIYHSWSFRTIDEEIKRRYFRQIKDAYHISEEIKRMVKFQQLNLVKDPFAENNIDLILCRNVFIYFQLEAIATVLEKFYHALCPSGYLLTGHAELSGVKLTKFCSILFPESVIYLRKESLPNPVISPTKTVASSRFIQPVNKSNSFIVPINSNSTISQSDEEIVKKAESFVQQKAYDLALKELNRMKVKNFKAYYLLGQIYANQGKYTEAIAFCQEALKINDLATQPLYLLAQIAEEKGNLEEVKSHLKRIIYLEPSSLLAYLDLIGIYQREGDTKRKMIMQQSALNILKKLPGDTPIPEQENLTVAQLISKLEA